MIHQKRKIAIMAAIMSVIGATLSFAGNIVIKGSTTVLPIAQKVSEEYMKLYPEVKISLSGGGSGNGMKAIIDGSTDIANSSRFIKDSEVKLALEKGRYPVPFAVAYDCIVPVVHPSNPVKDLTLSQLKAIYKGEVTNWSQVGGGDLKIVVISRDTSSGTYEVWEEKVMSKENVYPGALLQASNGAVHQAVSKNKNAIGYIGLGYLDASVKALTVGNVQGTPESTLDGSFPISRPLYMFTEKWPAGDVANFLNFIIHPEKGQKMIKEIGFVPLY
jgi:phosphate transport system substrate-binding protein